MESNDNHCVIFLDRFQEITRKPTQFLEANEEFCKQIKESLKNLYDFTKSEELKCQKKSALPELILKNFDLEQVWQQIELQNDFVLTQSLKTVSKLIVGKNRLLFNNLAVGAEENADEVEENKDEVEENKDEVEENEDEVEENEDKNVLEESPTASEDLSQSSEDDEEKPEPKKNIKPSIVDDEFFKLNEMEQFLEAEEKKMNKPDLGNDTENSDSESESIDLFNDEDDGDDDNMKTARYKDFFVAQEETGKRNRRNKFLEEMEEEEEEEEEPKSSFEKRQERLSKKIEDIEDEAVREKPWQLQGEITGENRPQNSLLEEIVDFDLTTRPPPVITEQTTMQLEDIIKQRIKDKVFDSVERKAKPVDTPLEYKKKIVLEQEKSKESLAQIYEKEFLEQQAALENPDKEEKEPELHQEINSMMKSLFTKLDSLSNFHFTPKPAIPELKIVSNLPAINMEEVAPVAMSEAALLAPEEVKKKPKGDVISKNERTVTDKKRERRKKKLKQKVHVKEKEKIVKKMKPGLGNKYSKQKIKDVLEKVTKEKNVDKMNESLGGKYVKSSKAFFTQLQEEVKTQIKRKSSESHTKNNKRSNMNAKKLKL